MPKNSRFRRDRAGEIYQADLTEEDLPEPRVREEADHELKGIPVWTRRLVTTS